MQRLMLRAKIHRATVTGTELHYEGSLALDRNLMEAADLLPGEMVQVLNLNTGSRLETYLIEAPAGSGAVVLNGPAARTAQPGDLVIILASCVVSEEEARQVKPRIVYVDEKNRPVRVLG